MQTNGTADDGYRYGVMFSDGSVAQKWNGNTQRERAAAYLNRMAELCPNDNISLCRLENGVWVRVPR